MYLLIKSLDRLMYLLIIQKLNALISAYLHLFSDKEAVTCWGYRGEISFTSGAAIHPTHDT